MDFRALEKNSRVEGFGPDADVVRCGDKYCFAAIAGRCSARHGAWEILVALHATLCRLQRAQGRGPTCIPCRRRWFWEIVHSYSEQQQRCASDLASS